MPSIITISIVFMIGLVVGWNVLPQPRWVRRSYDRFQDWLDSY